MHLSQDEEKITNVNVKTDAVDAHTVATITTSVYHLLQINLVPIPGTRHAKKKLCFGASSSIPLALPFPRSIFSVFKGHGFKFNSVMA